MDRAPLILAFLTCVRVRSPIFSIILCLDTCLQPVSAIVQDVDGLQDPDVPLIAVDSHSSQEEELVTQAAPGTSYMSHQPSITETQDESPPHPDANLLEANHAQVDHSSQMDVDSGPLPPNEQESEPVPAVEPVPALAAQTLLTAPPPMPPPPTPPPATPPPPNPLVNSPIDPALIDAVMHTYMFESSPVERTSGTIAPPPTQHDRPLSQAEISRLFSDETTLGLPLQADDDSVSLLAAMFGMSEMVGKDTNEPGGTPRQSVSREARLQRAYDVPLRQTHIDPGEDEQEPLHPRFSVSPAARHDIDEWDSPIHSHDHQQPPAVRVSSMSPPRQGSDHREHTGVGQQPAVEEDPVPPVPSPAKPSSMKEAEQPASAPSLPKPTQRVPSAPSTRNHKLQPQRPPIASAGEEAIAPPQQIGPQHLRSKQTRLPTPPSPTPPRRSGRPTGGLQWKDQESAGTHGLGKDVPQDPPTLPGPSRRKDKPVKEVPEKSSSHGEEKPLKTFIGSLPPEKSSVTNMLDVPATPVSFHFSGIL